MKFDVLQEDLASALTITSRFVNTRATLPVLANVLLTADKNSLSLRATNLEASICMDVGAKIEEAGDLCLPARMITELVSNLPKGPVSCFSEKEQLQLKSEGFSGLIPGLPANEFPNIPTKIGESTITVTRDLLIASLAKVLFAASHDETRPVLTGILFLFEEGIAYMVSSDGFRLSQKSIKIESTSEKYKAKRVILPKTVLAELSRLPAVEENIQIEIRELDNQVVLKSGQTILATRTVEGEFPDFKKIIPKSHTVTVNVDKETLARALKIASVFARDSLNIINLTVTSEGMEIEATSATGGSQKTRVEAKVDGGEVTISYNYKFIEEFLTVCTSNDVVIELTDSVSPGVFRDTKDPDFLHLIMPVRI